MTTRIAFQVATLALIAASARAEPVNCLSLPANWNARVPLKIGLNERGKAEAPRGELLFLSVQLDQRSRRYERLFDREDGGEFAFEGKGNYYISLNHAPGYRWPEADETGQ